MSPHAVLEFLALCLAAILIGVSKAGFGGGPGLLVGPLLALLFPATQSVGMMLPLLFACDLISLYPYWGKWDRRNVAVIVPGALAGVALGTWALGALTDQREASDHLLARIIGGMAIIFATMQVLRHRLLRDQKPFEPRLWHGSLAGLGTGFVSTLSHVGGMLTAMYLLPQRLKSEHYVGTTTAIYFLVNLAKIPAYCKIGVLNWELFQRDLLVLPVLALGTWLGVWLNRRIPGTLFMRLVLAVVFVAGIVLLVRG